MMCICTCMTVGISFEEANRRERERMSCHRRDQYFKFSPPILEPIFCPFFAPTVFFARKFFIAKCKVSTSAACVRRSIIYCGYVRSYVCLFVCRVERFFFANLKSSIAKVCKQLRTCSCRSIEETAPYTFISTFPHTV